MTKLEIIDTIKNLKRRALIDIETEDYSETGYFIKFEYNILSYYLHHSPVDIAYGGTEKEINVGRIKTVRLLFPGE